MLLTLALSVAVSASPKVDARLVGTWLAAGAPFVTLNANGTGTMEGEGPLKWTADGKTLVVTDAEGEADRGTYVVEGDAMTLTIGGFPLQLQRRGGKGAAVAKPAPPAPQEAAAPRRAGGDQLSQLLLSTAWCSFSFNKTAGTTRSSRVQFFANGTYALGARGETYSSGSGGTYAGQNDSGSGGRWAVQNGALSMSEGAGPLQVVEDLSVTRNSNGSPIIKADGREYSVCQ